MDEATFTRNGISNTQSNNLWSPKDLKSHGIVDTNFQVRFSINVPHCFRLSYGWARYLRLLQCTLRELLEDVPLATGLVMHFQHDGDPPYYCHVVKDDMKFFQYFLMNEAKFTALLDILR
ncbi:hypothetical protein PR048_026039 [Dryococelus australis]|uniref:Uncharacterized protein n=1 Tax=Dryococelus australis TaxID=614101 RepID=A0ABQ9GK80_9NEOP|nr:hypothetical protein PR048_026039 [Dryococelus australis]